MGEEEHRGGSGDGEDRISGLPDELLHDILARLRSAHAAARTSVLARRWRHVWAHLPELHLVAPLLSPALLRLTAPASASASFLDAVDGALAGYMAPTLQRLRISLQQRDVSITAGRVAPWLQFAAEHMAGEIHLNVPPCPPRLFEREVVDDEAVLELPACQGAKRIELCLTDEWWLRVQASGLFTALTSMEIIDGRMKGSELTSFVCTQCPCLRKLTLILDLIALSDVSFHSNTLHSVVLLVRNIRRLEVVAPKLEELAVHCHPMEAHISAPKLAEVVWSDDAYDPHLHRFADVGRSLRLLKINSSLVPSMVKQFDEVDELKLDLSISEGVAGYESFLNETNKLPKCKSIRIFLRWNQHDLVPSVLQLLKRCNSTKRISVLLLTNWERPLWNSCPPSCPCHLEENHKFDGIALSSLEEVEITDFKDSLENMELVESLSCNAAKLKMLVINVLVTPPLTKEIYEKICGLCHANVEVKFNVLRRGRNVSGILVQDIRGRCATTVTVLVEFLKLWDLLSEMVLQPDRDDSHRWQFSSSGMYSAKSAYEGFFIGAVQFRPWERIWKCWAPGKCKFFMWLVAHKKCWTADRLAKRGLPHPERCPLCDQAEETIDHLLISCVFARQVWYSILVKVGLHHLSPQPDNNSFDEWWASTNAGIGDQARKGLNSIITLGAWSIWNHRNRCVFDGALPNVNDVLDSVIEELRLWGLAGARGINLAALAPANA